MGWRRYPTATSLMASRTTHKYSLHREHGFTLHEVMIAVAIFSFGLLGLSSMQITGIKLSGFTQATTQLATVAQEQMEVLLGMDFTGTWLNVNVLRDTSAVLGVGTTYCALYPPEGIRPCTDPAYHPVPKYCVVTTQPPGGSNCDDNNFPPPVLGTKIQWTVDVIANPAAPVVQIAHIHLIASRKKEGKGKPPFTPRTFELSFARSNL